MAYRRWCGTVSAILRNAQIWLINYFPGPEKRTDAPELDSRACQPWQPLGNDHEHRPAHSIPVPQHMHWRRLQARQLQLLKSCFYGLPSRFLSGGTYNYGLGSDFKYHK